jgi:hypothetical protein
MCFSINTSFFTSSKSFCYVSNDGETGVTVAEANLVDFAGLAEAKIAVQAVVVVVAILAVPVAVVAVTILALVEAMESEEFAEASSVERAALAEVGLAVEQASGIVVAVTASSFAVAAVTMLAGPVVLAARAGRALPGSRRMIDFVSY